MISEYYVGQKPARPLGITVKDSRGRNLDVGFYENYSVRLVGSDNENVELGNAQLQTAGSREGKFVFIWPTDRSLFKKPGDYLLQLVLSGGGKLDFTTTHSIRVKEVGK